jgi:hypothetical protein
MKSRGVIYGETALPNRKKVLPSQYVKEKLTIDMLNQ